MQEETYGVRALSWSGLPAGVYLFDCVNHPTHRLFDDADFRCFARKHLNHLLCIDSEVAKLLAMYSVYWASAKRVILHNYVQLTISVMIKPNMVNHTKIIAHTRNTVNFTRLLNRSRLVER